MTDERQIGRARVVVVQGDLTQQDVGAIVNAANELLQHGGGVAAAIARAGGPDIRQESDRWLAEHGPLRPGRAALTGAGHLPAQWVVHVAGPHYEAGRDNEELLRMAVQAALDATAEAGATSVALPAISAGIFGYPRQEATGVIAATVVEWLNAHPDALEEVRLVGYDPGTTADFAAGLAATE